MKLSCVGCHTLCVEPAMSQNKTNEFSQGELDVCSMAGGTFCFLKLVHVTIKTPNFIALKQPAELTWIRNRPRGKVRGRGGLQSSCPAAGRRASFCRRRFICSTARTHTRLVFLTNQIVEYWKQSERILDSYSYKSSIKQGHWFGCVWQGVAW